MKRLAHLPESLRIVCVAFALAPLAFVAWCVFNYQDLGRMPPWHLGLLSACYIALPVILSVLMSRRHPSFLYVLIGECLGLLALAFLLPARTLPSLFYVHYVYVIMMVVMALMLVNRDILFPFVLSGYRGWRGAPRLAVNQRVRITFPRLDVTRTMMIEDCSLTGLALYTGEEVLEDLLPRLHRNEPVLLSGTVGAGKFEVSMELKWQARISTIAKLGLRARDLAAMERLYGALSTQSGTGRSLGRRLSALWANRHIRRAGNLVLAVLLTGGMILPPLFSSGGLRVMSKVWSGGPVADTVPPAPPAPKTGRQPGRKPEAPAAAPEGKDGTGASPGVPTH